MVTTEGLGPYAAAVLKFPRVRQSMLSAFDECALSARWEAEDRIGATTPQARGTIFHRVAAQCLLDMAKMKEGSIPVDAALAILHDVLRQDDADRQCPACGSTDIARGMDARSHRKCRECGHEFASQLMNLPLREVKDLYMVVKKFAHDTEWDVSNLVAVEERLSATVRYPDGHGGYVSRTVTGQLDALFAEHGDRDAIVIDFKDTWALPATAEVSFGGYFQQRFYALLVFDNYPSIERVTLREFYPRYSEPREATLTREALEDVRMEMAALVERFDRSWSERLFPPSPGKRCSFCLRPEACPIPINLRREGKIIDAADAQRTARQLVVGAAVAKQARAALQAWSDVHGPVPIRDAKGPRVYGYVASERVERPTREALETALALGEVNPDRLYRKTLSTRYVEHVPRKDRSNEEDAVILAALEGALAEAHARGAE
jgi:predicted RNA-binding Zn-ribbon protein involved in translation (DUF1610 family)